MADGSGGWKSSSPRRCSSGPNRYAVLGFVDTVRGGGGGMLTGDLMNPHADFPSVTSPPNGGVLGLEAAPGAVLPIGKGPPNGGFMFVLRTGGRHDIN